MTNGFIEDGKFHPITQYKKGVRKSRDQSAKLEGVRLKRETKPLKVTPTETLEEELSEVVPESMIRSEVKRIQKSEVIEQKIPEGLLKNISLDDVIEIENMSGSKIKKVTEEKVDGLTVYNFEMENGEEIFIFKSLPDETKFVEDNITSRFMNGQFDDKEFTLENEEYDLIDFTKMGLTKDINNFVMDHSMIKDSLKDEISFFTKSPMEWLEKANVKTKVAIKKGALLRDSDKFIAFKRKEGGGELVDFDHPDYELLETLPSYKHSFKEK